LEIIVAKMFPKINFTYLLLGICLANSAFARKAKVYTTCLKPGQFALTFDDGPNPDTTPKALEVLEKYKIKATFFINSRNWGDLDNDKRAVEVVKKAYAAGHDIGSHTYFHKDLFTALEDNTLKQNVDDMTDKIESIIGVKPAYFRPPSGNGGYAELDAKRKEMTDKIQEYLGERGYNIIMWGTDTRDWEFKENVDKVIENLNQQLTSPGVSPKTNSFITLLHDVHASTVNTVLPAVIEYVKNLGYTFVPLSECIGVRPYQGVSSESNQNLNNSSSNTTPSTPENNQNTNTNPSDVPLDNNVVNPDITGSTIPPPDGNIINNDNINSNMNSNNNSSDATTLQYSILLSICTILFSIYILF